MDHRNLTLLTDLYELTMMQGYFKEKDANETVIFDMFYRNNPHGNGFAVCAGLDQVIEYIKSTGLHCEVGPFETTIEGESYDELMDIVKECQHVAVRAGAPKVSAYVKIVYRPDGEILTIDQKIGKYRDE